MSPFPTTMNVLQPALPAMTMSPEEIQAVLDKVKYRDWDFQYKPNPTGMIMVANDNGSEIIYGVFGLIKSVHKERDTFFPDQEVFTLIYTQWPLRRANTAEDIIQACWASVVEYQRHEAGELFQVNGEYTYHPHRKSNYKINWDQR